MKNLILIFGGKSAEHEVSVNSAKNIYSAIDKSKFNIFPVAISLQGTWYSFKDFSSIANIKNINNSNLPVTSQECSLVFYQGKPQIFNFKTKSFQVVDCAFAINHGTFGEDGCIQGYFKMMNLPFVGCDVLASSIGMDKDYMKRVLNQAQIPNAKSVLLTKNNLLSFENIVLALGLPFFIKPANMGSSVGIHKIKSEKEFNEKLADAFQYDHKILAEEYIEGREIECSVMGGRHSAQASRCGEIIPQHEFYSYDAKYLDENGAVLKIPADLTATQQENLKNLALKTFYALQCEGLTRVDFFLKKNEEIFVNEINTLPGFTKISMYPKMWEASGITYQNLITKLIDLAFEKFNFDQKLKTSFLDLNSENNKENNPEN